jgi:Xaa-Pro aminopeptidase
MSEDERFISSHVSDLSGGGDWLRALGGVLTTNGLDKARIQVDEGGFSPTQLDSLRNSFPNATFEVGSEVLSQSRRVKAPMEVARLRKASSITESSIKDALARMDGGSTDVDLHREFLAAQVRQGARPHFEVVAVGSRTSLCNAEPNGTSLERDEVIRFDVGCKYMMYCSDIARNAVLGEVSSKIKRYYQAIRVGEQAGLEAIKPGVSASDLFHLMVDTVRRSGISHYERHHCGHGIGLEGYELPLIAPQDTTALEEGMVLCLETPYYELGVGGLQVEDMVLVTSDGCDLLTQLDREILVVD